MNARILLRAEQSGETLGAIEVTVPAGWPGPPLHRHAFAEAFYVLEGSLTFELDGERSTASVGDFVFAAGGAIHTLANFGDTAARYLLLCTPGGFERRFEEGAVDVPETIVVGDMIRRNG